MAGIRLLPESEGIEYRRQWNERALRTLIAFANGTGGELVIGVEDDLTVCGVEDADACLLQVASSVRDAVSPDMTSLIAMGLEDFEGRTVVRISVEEGPERPYYLASKGPCQAGVFVRVGPSTVQASQGIILKMLREDSPIGYEDLESRNQKLTFAAAEGVFAERHVAFGEAQMRTLGFYNAHGAYTNLAWLLSDQCPATVECALFQGDVKRHMLDRLETTGSLLAQLEEVTAFLKKNCGVSSYVGQDMFRVDTPCVPYNAYREAVLNLLVHQDYSVEAPALVSVFEHSMEFLNFGGLQRNVTLEAILEGLSKQRNPKLAAVFHRLKLVESYGMGIPLMFAEYEHCDLKPTFTLIDVGFKLTLPNQIGHLKVGSTMPPIEGGMSPVETGSPNSLETHLVQGAPEPRRGVYTGVLTPTSAGDFRTGHDPVPSFARNPDWERSYGAGQGSGSGERPASEPLRYRGLDITWNERCAIELASTQGEVRRADIERKTGLSQSSIINVLRGLQDKGILRRVGGGRSTRYELVPEEG